jgi:hypothetical protein
LARSRIGQFFRRIVEFITGAPEEQRPPPPPEPPRPPPPEPPPEPPYDGPGTGDDEFDQRLRDVFLDIAGGSWSYGDTEDDYQNYKELWLDTGVTVVEDDEDELVWLWDQFLRAFYLTSAEPGNVSRSQYYQDSGLGKDRIDWERYREIKKT